MRNVVHVVSVVVLFFLSIPSKASDFVDANGLAWKTRGDFSQCLRDMPADVILLRSCSLEPTVQDKTEVERASVRGYKNGRIVIDLKLSKKSKHIDGIAKDLLKLGLGTQDGYFKNVFESENPEHFQGFLNLFCSRGILCNSLVGKILTIAATELNAHSLERFNLEQKLAQEKLDLIDATNRLGRNTIRMSDKISPNTTLSVAQHHVAYTDATGKFPILSTFGAGPCVILAAYNRQDKRAALAHIDAGTELNCLGRIFGRIRESTDTPLEVHLAGGDSCSIDLICSLIGIVNNTKNVVIKSSNLNTYEANQLALDSTTGDIDDTFNIHRTYMVKDFDTILQIVGLPAAMGKYPLDEQKIN